MGKHRIVKSYCTGKQVVTLTQVEADQIVELPVRLVYRKVHWIKGQFCAFEVEMVRGFYDLELFHPDADSLVNELIKTEGEEGIWAIWDKKWRTYTGLIFKGLWYPFAYCEESV